MRLEENQIASTRIKLDPSKAQAEPIFYCGTLFFISCRGYDFTDEHHRRMAYFTFLDSWGMITPAGASISQDVWEKSQFHLPFRLSFELDRFSGLASERVIQAPFAPYDHHNIYMKFKSPTTKVIRVCVFYRVVRRLQINQARDSFLSHSLDQ